jgi:hypothetical protein
LNQSLCLLGKCFTIWAIPQPMQIVYYYSWSTQAIEKLPIWRKKSLKMSLQLVVSPQKHCLTHLPSSSVCRQWGLAVCIPPRQGAPNFPLPCTSTFLYFFALIPSPFPRPLAWSLSRTLPWNPFHPHPVKRPGEVSALAASTAH